MDAILDKLVEEFIPEGFKTSTEDRDVSVDVLGNSDTSVLNATEADLQVTLKTFVVPDINEDTLKEELKGKNLTEAQRVLGEIRNVKTYELKINPNIPLLTRVPRKVENITIKIETNE